MADACRTVCPLVETATGRKAERQDSTETETVNTQQAYRWTRIKYIRVEIRKTVLVQKRHWNIPGIFRAEYPKKLRDILSLTEFIDGIYWIF